MKMILIDSNQKWVFFSGNISKWIYEYINSLKWKHWSHIKSGSLINVDFLVKGCWQEGVKQCFPYLCTVEM